MAVFSNSFSKMLKEIGHECKISSCLKYHKDSLVDTEVNYITMRGSMISYLPAGKEHRVNDDGRWIRDGRQEGKPARIARKLFPDWLWTDLALKDTDLENFTNLVRSYTAANGDGEGGDTDRITMWVCNGEFISQYYSEDALSEHAGGNLRGSCMLTRDSGFFDIYRYNPHCVSMVVALDSEHKLLGRALIWNTSIGKCMDTVYAKDDVRPMFIKFAKDNDLYYKSSQSCHHHDFDMKGDVNVGNSEVHTRLSKWCFDEYPYLDTMMYLKDNGVITNDKPDDEHKILRCTDGGYDDGGNYTDDCITGDRINEDDATYIDYRFEGRWYTGYTTCDVVDAVGVSHVLQEHAVCVSGEHYLSDSEYIVFIERLDEYILSDDATFLDNGEAIPSHEAVEHADTGEWMHIDDAVEIEDGWLYEYEAEKVDGQWVRKGSNQTENQQA